MAARRCSISRQETVQITMFTFDIQTEGAVLYDEVLSG